MSRSRSAMRTWAASLASTAVTMMSGFVVTPIVLGLLGKERYGVVRTLTEAFSYLSLVGGAITVSLVPLIASAMGRGDRPAAHRSLGVGLRIYGIAGLALFALGALATPALHRLIPVPPDQRRELEVAWLILLAGVPLMTLLPLRILVDVDHRGYLVNVLLTVQGVLTAALSVGLALAGWGVVGVLLATLVASVVFHGGLLAMCLMLYPGLFRQVRGARPGRDDYRALLRLSGPTTCAMLSERVSIMSDSLVLSGVLGTAAATVLFVTQRLANLGFVALNAIGLAIWPGLAELFARGEVDAFNRRLVELTRLVGVVAMTGLAPVIAYNSRFIALWVGPDVDGGTAIVVAASLNSLLLSLASVYSSVLVSTGHVRRLAVPSMIQAAINLVLSLVLTKLYGPIGPLLGTAFATLGVSAWFFPSQLRQVFGTSPRALFRALAVPLAWGSGYAAALYAIARVHTPPMRWLGLLGEMSLGSLGFLALASVFIFSAEERTLWRARFARRRPVAVEVGSTP